MIHGFAEYGVIPESLYTPDIARVRWLLHASDEEVESFCANPDIDDPIAIHTARFTLHIVRDTPLPNGYAADVLRATQYAEGDDTYRFPQESYLKTMAFYVVDLDFYRPDVEALLRVHNVDLVQAVIFRCARDQRALSDERLRMLSFSEGVKTRQAIARILGKRPSIYRNEILTRLLHDPVERVASTAGYAAQQAISQADDPELRDVLAAKGWFELLGRVGDPRARAEVEALIDSGDSIDGEAAVAMAYALRDRDLMARLWSSPNWDTRSCAIILAGATGWLKGEEFAEVLAEESLDHIADLVFRWPPVKSHRLGNAVNRLCKPEGILPPIEELRAGNRDAMEKLKSLDSCEDKRSMLGAALRLLPSHAAVAMLRDLGVSGDSGVRGWSAHAVERCDLGDLYSMVAELCMDPDEDVANEAKWASRHGAMPCGLYGLDTAILKLNGSYRLDWLFAWRSVVESTLDWKASVARKKQSTSA